MMFRDIKALVGAIRGKGKELKPDDEGFLRYIEIDLQKKKPEFDYKTGQRLLSLYRQAYR